MASGRGKSEERGRDGGGGRDEEDLKWRFDRRRRESSDGGGEDGEVRSGSSVGAEFGDDSDGLGGAPPEDEASNYYDELDAGDDAGEEGGEVGELAAMATETQSSEGEEDREQMEREQKEKEAVAVPTRGAFYMHDDRTSRPGRGRQTYGARRLTEPHDEGKWQHDKFEEVQGSNDKNSSRTVKGRGPIKYPLARGYNGYPPKEHEEVWKSKETRSYSGRVLAEASSQQGSPALKKEVSASHQNRAAEASSQPGSPALKKEVSASHQNRAAEASSQQVGSPALKKEVSASHQNRAAPMDYPTMSSFNRAISALTKGDEKNTNTEGNSPKSVLPKNDLSTETSFAPPLVRGLGDSAGRGQHSSKELIWENNPESVQWQRQGTSLPSSPQYAYQYPASNPNGGSPVINDHVVRQTFLSNSFPPYVQGYVPQYSLFGPSSRAIVPSASEIGTLVLPPGLNKLNLPVADRQAASLPPQPVMTWANSIQSLEWNGQGVYFHSSSQNAYQYVASNQNGGDLMTNNHVIPQTPFHNSIQPQFQGYGQQLYSPPGSSDGLNNSEIAMGGRGSGADGTYGRTYSGVETYTNQNLNTTGNLLPVNQVSGLHLGELDENGAASAPANYAAQPSFGYSASGLARPQVWPDNAGSVGSAYPFSSTYATPTTSAYGGASSTEPESSLSIIGNQDTGRPHEGSNPVNGSEMQNTTRGDGGHKLQRYSKMNFDRSK